MGSTGSGNFTDYSGSGFKRGQGGTSNEDICNRAFSTKLEEIERSEYYITHRTVPPLNSVVTIEIRTRPAAIAETGELIGYLPTRLNYLLQCFEAGFTYQGIVSIATTTPITIVEIDCAPL